MATLGLDLWMATFASVMSATVNSSGASQFEALRDTKFEAQIFERATIAEFFPI